MNTEIRENIQLYKDHGFYGLTLYFKELYKVRDKDFTNINVFFENYGTLIRLLEIYEDMHKEVKYLFMFVTLLNNEYGNNELSDRNETDKYKSSTEKKVKYLNTIAKYNIDISLKTSDKDLYEYLTFMKKSLLSYIYKTM